MYHAVYSVRAPHILRPAASRRRPRVLENTGEIDQHAAIWAASPRAISTQMIGTRGAASLGSKPVILGSS